MTTLPVFFCFFFLSSPDALYYDTCLSRHVDSSLCGSSPASADARSGKRGLRKRRAKTRRSRADTLMHYARLHLLGFLCCLLVFSCCFFFIYIFFSHLTRCHPPSPRQLLRCRRWAGRRSTPWISTPVRAWGRGLPITLTTNLCGRLTDR